MASLIILKGSNNPLDLTRYIPMSQYNVNNHKNYQEWVDSNRTVHRQKTDEKAQGDFTLRFPSINSYREFVTYINEHSDPQTGAIGCEVWLTNEFRTKNIYAFLDFDPANDLPLLADNKSEGFTVTLQERGF